MTALKLRGLRAPDRNAIQYTSLRAEDSDEALLAFASSLAAAMPTTVVVDRRGRVAARVVGPTTYSMLSALVEDVVSGGCGTKPRAQGLVIRVEA